MLQSYLTAKLMEFVKLILKCKIYGFTLALKYPSAVMLRRTRIPVGVLSLCVCLCVGVSVCECVSGCVCVYTHKTQNSNPPLSLSVGQQNQLLYWGPPLQTVYEGIRGSLTAPSNTHPAWPPRLWPLDTLKMRLRWKEGMLRGFPRDEFDHTSSKNESIIQKLTKARVEAVRECCASLLGEALCFYCLHWAWECRNNV